MGGRSENLNFRVKFYIILSLILIHLLFSLNGNEFVLNGKLRSIENYQDIEAQTTFSFSVISDNHGVSPYGNINMAKANYHIEKSKDVCVLGVGDHLTATGENEFLYFVCNDPYWHANFYPSIGDNENAFYGNGQGDWGAGKAFYDALDIPNRKQTIFSPQKTDYYSIIDAPKGYKIHFITLHFPDHPVDTKIAFKESSKEFLRNCLLRINKSQHDIIVLAAHSQYGSWVNELSPDLQKLVMTKADLVFGASTHYFERTLYSGYESSGPLLLNSGSIISPRFKSSPGFVQVRVLENHRGIYVSYVDVSKPTTIIRSTPFAYFRSFSGRIFEVYYNQL